MDGWLRSQMLGPNDVAWNTSLATYNCCVTLGNVLTFSEPQLHLLNEDNKYTCFKGVLREFK